MKNVTLEEKKIREFAYIYAKSPLDDKQYNAEIYAAVISGAKSDAAKEYHTKGMFTQEQLDERLDLQACETTAQVIKNLG